MLSGVGPKDIALIQLCYELPEHSQAQGTAVQQNGTGRLQPRNVNVPHQPHQPSPLAPRKREHLQNTFQRQVEGVCARKSHCLLLHVSKCGACSSMCSHVPVTRCNMPGHTITSTPSRLAPATCSTSGAQLICRVHMLSASVPRTVSSCWLDTMNIPASICNLYPAGSRVQHVNHAGFPDALRSVLESPCIKKAGIGIRNDCEKLWLDKRCKLANTLDINTELNCRQQPSGCQLAEYTTFTLAEACERLLGKGLPKPQTLRYECTQ